MKTPVDFDAIWGEPPEISDAEIQEIHEKQVQEQVREIFRARIRSQIADLALKKISEFYQENPLLEIHMDVLLREYGNMETLVESYYNLLRTECCECWELSDMLIPAEVWDEQDNLYLEVAGLEYNDLDRTDNVSVVEELPEQKNIGGE